MPKLTPQTQTARRDNILSAAERCFARSGFHRTTMQEICREASVSPGALYVYFEGKEQLIAGLCERDRSEFAERFKVLETAPDFLAALQAIGQQYFVEEAAHKRLFVVEMGVESTRNPRIAEIYRSVDTYCRDCFVTLFQRLKDEGRIAPRVEIAALANIFDVMGDGMFWRRAVQPDFDAMAVLPTMRSIIEWLINPVQSPDVVPAQNGRFATNPTAPIMASSSVTPISERPL